MKKIMFDDRYGLTQAVLDGRKTMTRRLVPPRFYENILPGVFEEEIISKSYYKVGEVVAVAQKYLDLRNCDAFYEALDKADPSFPLECIKGEKGCYNKMFVKAEWMPHRIRITDIKAKRLQDISDNDCIAEGIKCFPSDVMPDLYTFEGVSENWKTAREAFARLIDKVSGKGTWNRNPYVFAYTFELVKGGQQ